MANFYGLTTFNDSRFLPVLSKVKIGEQIYYLKDAEMRALVETFGDAVTYSVDESFSATSENLATSKAIAEYVAKEITDLSGAMHFIGVKDKLPAVEDSKNGDVVIIGSAEYVFADNEWHLYGDEGVYATVAGVEATYVKKELTIAGINLEDAITAEELQTALGLGKLAYKDSASGTISGVVTAVEDATYTPAGSVAVELTQTATAMASTGNFTPAGTVSGKTTAAGKVALAKDNENGFEVSGSVSAPTVTVTPETAQVQYVTSVGSLPSYTAAQYVAPSVTEAKSGFATAGLVAAMDADDAEMLVFSAATIADALTGTGFNAGSYTAAEFNAGALPTLGEAQTVMTGIEKAEASAPTFTGDKIAATFTGEEASIAATFAGTEGAVSVSGNYDKASVNTATFTGTEATISHDVTTGTKTVTVE